MHLEPLWDYLTVQFLDSVPHNALWQPPPHRVAREAVILRTGPEVRDLAPGDHVLVSTRYLTRVGDTYLLPQSGVLGLLAYSSANPDTCLHPPPNPILTSPHPE